MPSGRTHDAITFILAVPAFAVTYAAGSGVKGGIVVAAAFIFGGLMFGPDLDTVSRQYSRWSILRGLWFPYRSFFKHRSRFSHGLIFGALIRVIYFIGVITLAACFVFYLYAAISGGRLVGLSEVSATWRRVGAFVGGTFGISLVPMIFAGLWLGAASHTFTDMAGSYIKTGRVAKFL